VYARFLLNWIDFIVAVSGLASLLRSWIKLPPPPSYVAVSGHKEEGEEESRRWGRRSRGEGV
jgi:hypothetical protein